MKSIVQVSMDHAYNGLYLTPDMWFYGSVVLGQSLGRVVQEVIHAEQPLTHHYANFAEVIYDVYNACEQDASPLCRALMTLISLSMGQSHLDRGTWALSEVASSLYYRSQGIVETTEMPLLIPPELREVRIERPWEVTPLLFRRIIRVEPWLSWTELLRAEFRRNALTMSDPSILAVLRAFWESLVDKPLKRPTPDPKIIQQQQRADHRVNQAARRSIKRAVKLHERFHDGAALRTFINGDPLIIGGAAYDYCVQKCHSLLRSTIARDTGMTPVSMTIQNKQGAALATCCLVFRDVGVLDYLFHVRLMARNAVTEQQMLRAMHITSVTETFFSDPLHITKGILDRYTAPLHTIDNILGFCIQSSHWEDRLMFYDIWRQMALKVVLEAADLDQRYYDEVLSICSGRDPFSRTAFTPGLEIAIQWFNMAEKSTPVASVPLSATA